MDQQVSAVALVPSLRVAIARLRSGQLLEIEDACSLKQQLKDVFRSAPAARLPADSSLLAALVDFLSAALRLDARSCPDALGPALHAHSKLCRRATTAAADLVCSPEVCLPEAVDLATRLLRTGTLQCYSRLLAAAAEDTLAAAGGTATQHAAITAGGAGRLVAALARAAVRGMAGASTADAAGAAVGSSSEQQQRQEQQQQQQQQEQQQQQQRGAAFADELAAALLDSGVVEHLARTVLHLYLCPAQQAVNERPPAEAAVPLLRTNQRAVYVATLACHFLIKLHVRYCCAAQADGPAEPALRTVLAGRCVRHLALSCALAALCAADGGPSYGLPAGLLLGLPVLDNHVNRPVNLRRRQGTQQLGRIPFTLSIAVLKMVVDPGGPAPPPPPGRRAAAAVLLRLSRLAVESGRAWADVDAGPALVAPGGRSGGEAASSASRSPVRPPPDSPSGGGGGEGASPALGGPGSAIGGKSGGRSRGSNTTIDGSSGGGGSSGGKGGGSSSGGVGSSSGGGGVGSSSDGGGGGSSSGGGGGSSNGGGGGTSSGGGGGTSSGGGGSSSEGGGGGSSSGGGDGGSSSGGGGSSGGVLGSSSGGGSSSSGGGGSSGGAVGGGGGGAGSSVGGGGGGGSSSGGAGRSSGGGGSSNGGGGSALLPACPSSPAHLPESLRLLLPRDVSVLVAHLSLDAACAILAEQRAHREQHGPAAAAAAGAATGAAGGAAACWERGAAAEWWRLAVAAALHLPRWASTKQLSELAERVIQQGLCLGLLPLARPLPPSPPPMTAAALAAGALPCIERLLRRAVGAPAAAEVPLARSLAQDCLYLEALAPLLAYGAPRQAAALVATVGKLLAYVAEPPEAERDARAPDGTPLVICLLDRVREWMVGAAGHDALWQRRAEPGGRQLAGGRQLPGGQQLALVVSYAAAQWLSFTARLMEKKAPRLGDDCSVEAVIVSAILQPLLAWVPLLARCGALDQGPPAAPAAAAAGGWRRWLLEEVRIVQLLGSALGRLPPLLLREQQGQVWEIASLRLWKSNGLVAGLGWCCCIVAATFPDEVRSAALSAAAAEGGVASRASRGGAAGSSSRRRAGNRSSARSATSSSNSSNSSNSCTGGADWAAVAAASGPGGWHPILLRALAAELRAHSEDEAGVIGAGELEDLAMWLEECRARGSRRGAEAGSSWGAPTLEEGAPGLHVPAPAEARALLRTCANPACDNLAGGSEAELPLRACGRCGAAWYCRPECQAAHWRAGHREACGQQGPGSKA